jgi:hypothetical protein
MIMLPKITFKIKPLNRYVDVLYYFLNPRGGSWDWSKGILREYPVLQKKLDFLNDYNKKNEVIYEFFKEVEIKEKANLNLKRKRFEESWNKINDRALKTLSEIVEKDWPKRDKIINAYVTLNPICPRWIKQRTFDLFYKFNMQKMKAVSLHELLHFIYFEKWKEIFPKTNEKEFEGPGLVWELSEMVPPIILSDKRMQKILRHTPSVYNEYKTLKIKNKPILEYLQKFYDNRRDFEDFLTTSWRFIKTYEKEINSKLGRK